MAMAWTLRVQIEDGCNFDFGFEKNECVGSFFRCIFNNCINQSSIVQIPTFLSNNISPPIWNEALEWQFDDATLKKLKKCGSSIKLQLCLIKNWNRKEMSAFPLHHFRKNKQRYNVKEIGYVVLDLKNAISNGTKIMNANKPQMQATYLRIRNVKIAKNIGSHPMIKVAFWCTLQPKWADEIAKEEIECEQKVSKPKPVSNTPEPIQQKCEQKLSEVREKEILTVNDGIYCDNQWFCVIHNIDLFADIQNLRLLIVSMNEKFIINLPLNESGINEEFCNNYSNFYWYLQSSMDKTVTNEWNTIASYSANINEFISSNHSKKFVLRLSDSSNKCIAKATISMSWQSYANEINNEIISEKSEVYSEFVSEKSDIISQMSEISAFKAFENSDIRSDDLLLNKTDNISDNYKYRIGIDIRSIRDLRKPFNVLCKYKYALFDNNHLFQSKPSILTNESEEKAINNGFCAYEIVLKSNVLCQNLSKYPLIIQCFDCDQNIEFGYSFINLSDLIKASKSASNLRYIDKYYTIYAIKNTQNIQTLTFDQDLHKIKGNRIGNIRVCCSLEDFALKPKTTTDNTKKEQSLTEESENKNTEETEAIRDNFVKNAKYLQEEIINELKKWKLEQQKKWQRKWKLLETEKLQNLELEWKKNEEMRSVQLNKKKLEIIKLEKKLKTSLYDIECQEKKIKLEQIRIEERKRELNQNYKLKTNEIVTSLKRLRYDHKMETETLNRTINFLKNENELISTKYRNEDKRCNDFRDELNRNKKKYDSSSIGQLQIENNKLNNKIIELSEKLNEKKGEIKSFQNKLEESQLKIKGLHRQIVENSHKEIEKEKKQMEKLKLELMTKSHFKQLRNDRNELQQIKDTLLKVMNNQ